VPQRRQKRAVAESDSPQFEHGCTPDVAGTSPAAGGERTSWVDAAHRASLDARLRFARRAMLGDSSIPGWAGHCGSAFAAWGGTVAGVAGATGDKGRWPLAGAGCSGAKIRQVG
jgi:hypothetical protein